MPMLLWLLVLAASAMPASGSHGAADLIDYRAPLSAMPHPGRFYFLEFPPVDAAAASSSSAGDWLEDDAAAGAGPPPPPSPPPPSSMARCGDGTPFSFAFKRGSGPDLSKVVVEFTGGTALRVPWRRPGAASGLPLGGCAGVPGGMVRLAVPDLLGSDGPESAASVDDAGGGDAGGTDDSDAGAEGAADYADLPIGARGPAGDYPGRGGAGLGRTGLVNATDTWSYVLVPLCTADLHLGMRSDRDTDQGTADAYHRGGYNALAVLDWIHDNFRDVGGVDSLVVAGCGAGAAVAPAVFAARLAGRHREEGKPLRSVRAMMDGPHASGLLMAVPDPESEAAGLESWEPWDLLGLEPSSTASDALPAAFERLVQDNPDVQFAIATHSVSDVHSLLEHTGITAGEAKEAYGAWLKHMNRRYPSNFEYYDSPAATGTARACRFAFSASPDKETEYWDWMDRITADNKEGWNDNIFDAQGATTKSTAIATEPKSSHSDPSTSSSTSSSEDGSFRPTFLFVLAMISLSLTLVYLCWRGAAWLRPEVARRRRLRGGGDGAGEGEGGPSRNGRDDDDKDGSRPGDAGPRFLSPLDAWLTVLTRFPVLFLLVSLVVPAAISLAGLQKSGYAIDVNLDFESYLEIDTAMDNFQVDYDAAKAIQAESWEVQDDLCEILRSPPLKEKEEKGGEEERVGLRRLDHLPRKGERLNIFYQSPDWRPERGANVFEPQILEDMRDVEESIVSRPGYKESCYQSPYGDGECAPLDSIVDLFFDESGALTKDIDAALRAMLGEGIVDHTDRYFSLSNLGSNYTRTTIWMRKGSGARFLEDLHSNLLWPADRAGTYQNVVFSWYGSDEVAEIEVHDALIHDASWAAGTIIVVGFLILLKVRNLFVFAMAMAGLVLAFPVAYYWYSVHFEIREMTIVNVSALFVMLGIGADDIFLMIDAYSHTKVFMGPNATPSERMKVAYRRAGSMMLVSSVVSALCFYSNVFSVMLIVREFGIFMGTVVLVNFIHVMTVLPSALLVNDIYLLPFVEWFWGLFFRTVGLLPPVMEQEPSNQGKDLRSLPSVKKSEDYPSFIEEIDDSGAEWTARRPRQGVEEQPALEKEQVAEESRLSMLRSRQHQKDNSFDVSEDADSEPPKFDDTPPVNPQKQLEHQEQEHTIPDAGRMNRVDRWFYARYTPFIFRHRWCVVLVSVVVAIILGSLGYANFEMSDKGIVLFTSEYNLGRISTIKNTYIKSFSSFKTDKIVGKPPLSAASSSKSEGGGTSLAPLPTATQTTAPASIATGNPTSSLTPPPMLDPTPGPTSSPTSLPTTAVPSANPISVSTGTPTLAVWCRPRSVPNSEIHYGVDSIAAAKGRRRRKRGKKKGGSGAEEAVQQSKPGDTAVVLCNTGYSGGGALTCMDDGEWSPSDAAITCSPKPCASMTVANSDRSSPVTGTTGDSVSISCKPGFVGGGTITCKADGTFSNAQIACRPMETPTNGCAPIAVPHSNIQFEGESVDVSSSFEVLCDEGYSGSTTITCRSDGNWDPSEFACLANDCTPTSIPNSDKDQPNSIKGSTGDKVAVTCNSGYRGSGYATCLPSGTFTTVNCNNSCPPMEMADSVSPGVISGVTGDVVEVECLPGYQGGGKAVCGPDGLFDLAGVSECKRSSNGKGNGIETRPPTPAPMYASTPETPRRPSPPSLQTPLEPQPPSPAPLAPMCPNPCRNGGLCDTESLTCQCADGFRGEECEIQTCPTICDGERDEQGQCLNVPIQCSRFGECQPIGDGTVGEQCVCDEEYTGADCTIKIPSTFLLKETFSVTMVWGIKLRDASFAELWDKNKNRESSDGNNRRLEMTGIDEMSFQGSFDLSDPDVQLWLWKVCRSARDPSAGLNVRDEVKTWIEILQEEAEENDIPFPLPKDMFAGYLQLMMENSRSFRNRFKNEIGTTGPGLGGDFLYASITMLAEVPIVTNDRDTSDTALKQWKDFVSDMNMKAPSKAGPAVVQSNAFTDAHFENEILSTTVTTWAFANGVCLAIILMFTQNVSVSLIVMVTVILMMICLLGLIFAVFAIPFGAVEAIGVTIFVGLSVNYSLHIAHAYHNTFSRNRMEKMQLTVFTTASPITASAVSTIGGCAFLLGCRVQPFNELGIVLMTNTAMALIFSLLFLVAVLSIIGPLPYEGQHMHQCDFKALFSGKCCVRGQVVDDGASTSEVSKENEVSKEDTRNSWTDMSGSMRSSMAEPHDDYEDTWSLPGLPKPAYDGKV